MTGHVNISNSTRPNSTDDTYKKVIEQIQADKVCPFCEENLEKYHKNPILFKTDHWIVTTNMYPYKNTKHHFLFIHRTHITDTHDMTGDAFKNLQECINRVSKDHYVTGGTLIMRCGDTNTTGASVTHIHAQFTVADMSNPNREPILARVG